MNILYTILSATSFSTNYNKNDKLRLRYEIKYDLYKISQIFFKSLEKHLEMACI